MVEKLTREEMRACLQHTHKHAHTHSHAHRHKYVHHADTVTHTHDEMRAHSKHSSIIKAVLYRENGQQALCWEQDRCGNNDTGLDRTGAYGMVNYRGKGKSSLIIFF